MANETILEEAHRLVNGPRRENYSHPYDNFSGIADLWHAAFGWNVTPHQVALAMILTKINRENFRHNRDNIVDIAGYAQCLQLVEEERVRRFQESAGYQSSLGGVVGDASSTGT